MKLDFTSERVLAVVAHPDDAELLCAGTLARARNDGSAIGICVMCKGDRGRPPGRVKNLAATRQREATAAVRILGAKLYWQGYGDATLTDAPAGRQKLVEVYRQFKPTLVLAHSPQDYHADHRAASSVAEAASWLCASRGQVTRSPALARVPAMWVMDTVMMHGFEPGFYVDVSAYQETKVKMLSCHRSQLRRSETDLGPLLEYQQNQARARGLQADVEAAEAFRIHHALNRVRAW